MAKSIMIQGTMSSAGKSLLVTALCRILKQDGYKVAPFKSQNMALNSFITEDGYEMGRAQVVQAEAAGIKPSVLMNPILLKPTTDVGSQVIVNGEVRGNMTASNYFKYKKELIPEIMHAYHTLEKEYDIIVIEGAGSPAEINLKSEDIVNMGMARMAKAPVLLVGDIDRGGVFAQLYGTIALLAEEERAMVKGMIINKFRGDVKILEPGLTMLSDRLNPIADIPFVGVVPYTKVDIEEEDSISERFLKKMAKKIDIAVIRLPRISNYTDFHNLERFPNVSVRYIAKVSELLEPDMIILPGTKNTIADLKFLRESGLEAAILKAQAKKSLIFGICGGYQMLGEMLRDPFGVEGGGEIKGLSLLPVDTVFSKEKIRKQNRGTFGEVTGMLSGLTGKTYQGYEIHMGESTWISKVPVNDGSFSDKAAKKYVEDRAITSVLRSNGDNVYGTYLHGIFDEEGICKEIIGTLCEKKGIALDEIFEFSYKKYKEEQYDKLADAVRDALDMEKIYQIMEEGV
jgi:adenosylcobyric acid synthase|nr:cobyric acid synthase [uncultured Lachnoclostridium sp.]